MQGVGFRHFMTRAARDLGITGWVRNRTDGSVEAVVAGAPDAVHTMLGARPARAAHARVTGVEVTAAEGDFERFEMQPTED